MALDDMISIESAFVAAATATALSSKGRNTIRQGAVYGIAGALKAGDVVAGAARGAVRGVRGDDTAVSDAATAGGSRRSQGSTSRDSSRSRTASSSGSRRTPRRTGASSPAERTAADADAAETGAGA